MTSYKNTTDRFVERVQYQLGSIGGGGAGFIKDLDDVDISGLEDGYVLKWNSASNKWKPEEAGGVGAGGTWASSSIGIHTTKNVGIGTTARSDFASTLKVISILMETSLLVAQLHTKT